MSGWGVRMGTGLGRQRAVGTLAAEARMCLPGRLLLPKMALAPFWGVAEHSWGKAHGGCKSQRALREAGRSAATGLVSLIETPRKQTWTW